MAMSPPGGGRDCQGNAESTRPGPPISVPLCPGGGEAGGLPDGSVYTLLSSDLCVGGGDASDGLFTAQYVEITVHGQFGGER